MAATFQFFSGKMRSAIRGGWIGGARRAHGAGRLLLRKGAENSMRNCEARIKERIIINNNNNLKCTIIPVIIGATGIVRRSLRKYLEAVPGKHSVDSLQKTAVLGTSHIIRKVLQRETGRVNGGDHRWFNRSTGEKSL
jgi:hypothetical protein